MVHRYSIRIRVVAMDGYFALHKIYMFFVFDGDVLCDDFLLHRFSSLLAATDER